MHFGGGGFAAAPVRPDRGQSAHQRKPRFRHGSERGPRLGPVADGSPLRGDGPGGRNGVSPGPPLFRDDGRRGAGALGPARGDAALRAPRQLSLTPSASGPSRLSPVAGPFRTGAGPGVGSGPPLSVRADPPPGPAGRHPLPGRQGAGRGVHAGRRGDPGPVRLADGPGDRQRPPVPAGAVGSKRPGNPDRDLPGGGGGVRGEHGSPGVVEPGGAKDRRRPAGAGPIGRAPPPTDFLPAQRRAGDFPERGVPGPGAGRGGDGASRADRHGSARRPLGRHPGQCHAGSLRGRGRRLLYRDPAGPGPAGGTGHVAGRVPEHGQPRPAGAVDFDPGLGVRPAGGLPRPGPVGDEGSSNGSSSSGPTACSD